jgi:molybdopterin molybdotransferase
LLLPVADTGADWLSVAEARASILDGVPRLQSEVRPLSDCLGSVMAERILSPLDLPPWNNSAMDGFAVLSSDVLGASETEPIDLRVVEDVPAGGFPTVILTPGAATRVMTGAPVPQGAEGVIRVEHTDGGTRLGTAEARVRINRDEDAGRNVRQRGEDLRRGDCVLDEGAVVRAAEIGVAASVGRSQLRVVRRPIVGIVSSGDELVEVDGFPEVLAGRKIVSSNGYSLAAQVEESHMEARRLGIAVDDPALLRERITAARGCDALVTSAGISVGAHDHTRRVLEELGVRVAFWRVRMKPGSPFAFGWIGELGGIPWFGLPGNPVSAMVTFELFVRPALLRMAGHQAVFPPIVTATLPEGYPIRPGLTHFPRARLADREGTTVAMLTGAQGSGILTSMAAADALLVIPEDSTGVSPGEEVRAIVLGGAPLRELPGY